MTNEPLHVLAPPPIIYAPVFVAGILIHLAFPLRPFPEPWIGHAAGWPLVAGALLLGWWAYSTMTHADEA